MMTCIVFSRVNITEVLLLQLTTQHGKYNYIYPIHCVVHIITWNTQLVIILVVGPNALTHNYLIIMSSQV
jgi:hypothetical protein